jgi:hypothetical protein
MGTEFPLRAPARLTYARHAAHHHKIRAHAHIITVRMLLRRSVFCVLVVWRLGVLGTGKMFIDLCAQSRWGADLGLAPQRQSK